MKAFTKEKVRRTTGTYRSLRTDPAATHPMFHEHAIPMTGLWFAHSHSHDHTNPHKHWMVAHRMTDKSGYELPATMWDWREET